MNIKYISIIIILATFFTGCYDTDNIESELGEEVLAPKDNPSDPVDHYIYEFYSNYGTFIMYDYDTIDYQWNIKTRSDKLYSLQDDKDALSEGIDFFNKVLGDRYDDTFKKKYFPTKIFLADSINIIVEQKRLEDRVSSYGISNLSIGRIREGVSGLEADSLNTLKGIINADFWAGYLYINAKIDLPITFFRISGDIYGQNMLKLPENEDVDAEDIDMLSYGFWANNNGPSANSKYYWMAPDVQADIWQFIKMITSHTKNEMDALMDGYNNMKDKYNIIIDYVKENFNVDLQEIGNHNNL